jgi:hypothetical protein
MSRELHTAWRDFHADVDEILVRAHTQLAIWDADLAELGLEREGRFAFFPRMLAAHPLATIRLALRRVDHLYNDHPRLVALQKVYGQRLLIRRVSGKLLHLRDTLILADATHALIRHEQDQPRATRILDDAHETKPWQQRFEDIWAEGGEDFHPTTLGL